jgi:DNA-binding beta-propeller fold protein YncE
MWRQWMLPVIALSIVFACCKDDDADEKKKAVYNPSDPVTVSSIFPDSGRVAALLLIRGSNFGTDTSLIKVFINGKKAALTGVDNSGSILSVIVPSLKERGVQQDEGDRLDADVTVQIGNGAEKQESTAGTKLHYTFSKNVSTLAGFTDEDGLSAIVDGPLEQAQFNEPFWIAFDQDKNFYLIEENNGLRFINMEKREVKTIFRTGNGVGRPRTIAYTLDYDTMLIANDVGEWTGIGTIILLRNPVTREYDPQWITACSHKQCNGGAIHPITGEYYFNSYEQSQVFRMTRGTALPWKYETVIPKVQDNNWEFNIQFAPSGTFAYIVSKNKHYVAKAEFNRTANKLEQPVPFVGTKEKSGYQDGAGLNTLFNNPHQGVFDEYDNFYLCDGMNHCIRKITPTGQVTTFAGRAENYGYSDGALRDAQFDRPYGITYDKDIQTFYIADQKNRRIRTIAVE